jgi:hypothetical protein
MKKNTCIQDFGGDLRGGSLLEEPSIDGTIILKLIFKK